MCRGLWVLDVGTVEKEDEASGPAEVKPAFFLLASRGRLQCSRLEADGKTSRLLISDLGEQFQVFVITGRCSVCKLWPRPLVQIWSRLQSGDTVGFDVIGVQKDRVIFDVDTPTSEATTAHIYPQMFQSGPFS